MSQVITVTLFHDVLGRKWLAISRVISGDSQDNNLRK